MLGYSGEEMIGRPVTDFMYEEDVPDHLRKMEDRRQGLSENYERRFRHKDGQTVWTLVSATPILDDAHRFNGSLAMFTDITERKRAAEAIRLKADQYATMLTASADGFWLLDLDGKIRDINDAYCRMSGYSRDELPRPWRARHRRKGERRRHRRPYPESRSNRIRSLRDQASQEGWRSLGCRDQLGLLAGHKPTNLIYARYYRT